MFRTAADWQRMTGIPLSHDGQRRHRRGTHGSHDRGGQQGPARKREAQAMVRLVEGAAASARANWWTTRPDRGRHARDHRCGAFDGGMRGQVGVQRRHRDETGLDGLVVGVGARRPVHAALVQPEVRPAPGIVASQHVGRVRAGGLHGRRPPRRHPLRHVDVQQDPRRQSVREHLARDTRAGRRSVGEVVDQRRAASRWRLPARPSARPPALRRSCPSRSRRRRRSSPC